MCALSDLESYLTLGVATLRSYFLRIAGEWLRPGVLLGVPGVPGDEEGDAPNLPELDPNPTPGITGERGLPSAMEATLFNLSLIHI